MTHKLNKKVWCPSVDMGNDKYNKMALVLVMYVTVSKTNLKCGTSTNLFSGGTKCILACRGFLR
jgi:hypothetical protein